VQRQDYIERLIQQVAQAIARALGFAQSGDVERAKEELHSTWASFIGLRREDLVRLDAATARALLADRRELAIRILEAEAKLGNDEAARLLAAISDDARDARA
jgi:hypothetical protein